MAIKEYPPVAPFPGKIGRTLDESSPAWPQPTRAREGSPNIIFFVWDDVGYGQLSPFGGLCQTPTLDRLAKGGLRYTNFHTTAPCSPTRGCLLTGRNHHTLGLSAITELSLGYPAHNGYMGFEHGFLSEMLLEHGYNTFAVGKWHLTPPRETTTAGPFSRWPLGRGFERYYGFLGGDTDQWHPDLTYDNHPVTPPRKPEEGYHLNVDLADKAIEFIQDAQVNAPDKPFFLYYATGAGPAPHHVEKEWIDKYKGKFDMGWDEYRKIVFQRQKELGIVSPDAQISERDPDVPAWDSLSDDAKRMYARQMEVYAAESRNVTAEHPEKLREMVRRWYAEAGKYGVLPLASADMRRMREERPTVARPRQHFAYYKGGAPVAFAAAPEVFNRPHSITAEVTIPEGGTEGVLLTQGSRNAGYALFVKDGHLHYIHNYVGLEVFKLSSREPVPTGEAKLRYEFEPTGGPNFKEGKGSPGRAQLYINDRLVGAMELPYTTPTMFGVLGLSSGYAATH